MSELEYLAVALGLANVTLVVLRSHWNYPFGLAMVSLYSVIFYEAKLYSDMVLQGFFFAAQIYGWLTWRRASSATQVPVRFMATKSRTGWLAATIAAWLAWSAAMSRFTDAAAPWADGAVAMLSIAAQILLARRMVESWWLWIAVDLIAIPLFASRGLLLTAGLYGVFLVLAIIGWRQWNRAATAEQASL